MQAPKTTSYLIPDWQRAWRFLCVIASLLLALLSVVQADVLPLLQPLVAPQYWPWVSAGFAVAIVVLRIIAQPGLHAPDAERSQ